MTGTSGRGCRPPRRPARAVRWVGFDRETAELTVDDVRAELSGRTQLVAVTGASNLLGTRPDVPAIADAVHEAGALLYVDGVHLTPHAPVDVAALGADFYACSPYKFFGPHHGLVVAAPELLERIHPDKLLPVHRPGARAVRARHAALRAARRHDRRGRLHRRARLRRRRPPDPGAGVDARGRGVRGPAARTAAGRPAADPPESSCTAPRSGARRRCSSPSPAGRTGRCTSTSRRSG